MQRVLITGARGFIGRHLTNRLASTGCEVRAMTRSRDEPTTSWPDGVEVLAGDLDDPGLLGSAVAGCDTVFHLAAHVHALCGGPEDDARHLRVNVDGTRNLVDASVAHGVSSFVFFSSIKAMGERTVTTEDESVAPHPQTAYGRSKLVAEDHLIATAERAGFAGVCLRLPLVYGVGNKGNLYRMIAAIDRGRFPPLPELSNRRSMAHVSNVIDAAILAATSPHARGRRYIVTDARSYSTRELYTSICRAIGQPVPRWSVPYSALKVAALIGDGLARLSGRRLPFDSDTLEKLQSSACYSSARITDELGYRPRVDLDRALPELLHWYREGSK